MIYCFKVIITIIKNEYSVDKFIKTYLSYETELIINKKKEFFF